MCYSSNQGNLRFFQEAKRCSRASEVTLCSICGNNCHEAEKNNIITDSQIYWFSHTPDMSYINITPEVKIINGRSFRATGMRLEYAADIGSRRYSYQVTEGGQSIYKEQIEKVAVTTKKETVNRDLIAKTRYIDGRPYSSYSYEDKKLAPNYNTTYKEKKTKVPAGEKTPLCTVTKYGEEYAYRNTYIGELLDVQECHCLKHDKGIRERIRDILYTNDNNTCLQCGHPHHNNCNHSSKIFLGVDCCCEQCMCTSCLDDIMSTSCCLFKQDRILYVKKHGNPHKLFSYWG